MRNRVPLVPSQTTKITVRSTTTKYKNDPEINKIRHVTHIIQTKLTSNVEQTRDEKYIKLLIKVSKKLTTNSPAAALLPCYLLLQALLLLWNVLPSKLSPQNLSGTSNQIPSFTLCLASQDTPKKRSSVTTTPNMLLQIFKYQPRIFYNRCHRLIASTSSLPTGKMYYLMTNPQATRGSPKWGLQLHTHRVKLS